MACLSAGWAEGRGGGDGELKNWVKALASISPMTINAFIFDKKQQGENKMKTSPSGPNCHELLCGFRKVQKSSEKFRKVQESFSHGTPQFWTHPQEGTSPNTEAETREVVVSYLLITWAILL